MKWQRYMKLQETTAFIQESGVGEVEFGLILGSGLGELADEIENPIVLPYNDIPHFPVSTVVGHAGQLVYGTLAGKVLWCKDDSIIMKAIRCRRLLTPSVMAALKAPLGRDQCLWRRKTKLQPGDLMLITDQINFMGTTHWLVKTKMVHVSQIWAKPTICLIGKRHKSWCIKRIALKRRRLYGLLRSVWNASKIRFARTIGADAVGMTVPEVIVAVHSGLKVLGVSYLNLAAGMQASLNHEEVVKLWNGSRQNLKRWSKKR